MWGVQISLPTGKVWHSTHQRKAGADSAAVVFRRGGLPHAAEVLEFPDFSPKPKKQAFDPKGMIVSLLTQVPMPVYECRWCVEPAVVLGRNGIGCAKHVKDGTPITGLFTTIKAEVM